MGKKLRSRVFMDPFPAHDCVQGRLGSGQDFMLHIDAEGESLPRANWKTIPRHECPASDAQINSRFTKYSVRKTNGETFYNRRLKLWKLIHPPFIFCLPMIEGEYLKIRLWRAKGSPQALGSAAKLENRIRNPFNASSPTQHFHFCLAHH